jgi:hypothetical protein
MNSLSAIPLFIALGLVAGCGTISDFPPGTSIDQVQHKYGSPTVICPDADGEQRMVWSTQPAGRKAWATHVDVQGRVGIIEEVLTDEAFRRLDGSQWTQEQVRCEFGPPADVSQVGLGSARQLVWTYRYRQSGAWDAFMYIYFGYDGAHVRRFHPGFDFISDSDWWVF